MRRHERQIQAAARDTIACLRRLCGGCFPAALEGWLAIAKGLGVIMVPVWNVQSFEAMIHSYTEGKWFLLYNGQDSPVKIVGRIIHELAEVICVGNDPCFWDSGVYCYSGSPDPSDARHRAAQIVERKVLAEIQEG